MKSAEYLQWKNKIKSSTASIICWGVGIGVALMCSLYVLVFYMAYMEGDKDAEVAYAVFAVSACVGLMFFIGGVIRGIQISVNNNKCYEMMEKIEKEEKKKSDLGIVETPSKTSNVKWCGTKAYIGKNDYLPDWELSAWTDSFGDYTNRKVLKGRCKGNTEWDGYLFIYIDKSGKTQFKLLSGRDVTFHGTLQCSIELKFQHGSILRYRKMFHCATVGSFVCEDERLKRDLLSGNVVKVRLTLQDMIKVESYVFDVNTVGLSDLYYLM